MDELQAALKEHGDAAAVAEHIRDILADVDKDKDGRIDYSGVGAEEPAKLLHRVVLSCCGTHQCLSR